MPGMERYLQKKQRARQLAAEQQAREAKAFLQNPRARLEPCTVPEPFALQTELREVGFSPSTACKIRTVAELELAEQQCGSHCCVMKFLHRLSAQDKLEMDVLGCIQLTKQHDTTLSSSFWGMFTWQ